MRPEEKGPARVYASGRASADPASVNHARTRQRGGGAGRGDGAVSDGDRISADSACRDSLPSVMTRTMCNSTPPSWV